MSDTTTIATRYGTREVPAEYVHGVLGTKIVRVHGTLDWQETSGFYGDRFLVWSVRNQQYSMFRGPFPALRSAMHTHGNQGWGAQDIEDGELQKLLSWLAQHRNLAVWVSDEFLSPDERERFEMACRDLSKEMGRPILDVKRDILRLTLQSADAELPEGLAFLKEAIALDKVRIKQVEHIGRAVNVRSAAMVREIHRQQGIIDAAAVELRELRQEHLVLCGSYRGRADHFDRALALAEKLRAVHDRPFFGLALHTARDLEAYVQFALDGSFSAGGFRLNRSLAACEGSVIGRRIEAELYRLGMARKRGGNRRKELHSTATMNITQIARDIDPDLGKKLRNNPLPRVRGRLHDALHILRAGEKCSWEEARGKLRDAASLFG